MPVRPHRGSTSSADRVARARPGTSRIRGGRRGFARTPRRADPRARGDHVRRRRASSSAAASSSARNGPASCASRARGPCWTTRPAVEDRDLLGALGRGEPVGHEQAGAPGEQPLRGPHDLGLGDRVHAGRRLVEDHHPHVADEQARERDQLLLPGGEAGAARPEQGVEALGQARPPTPRDRARRPPARRPRAGRGAEQRDVLRERPGEDLGALGDHADRGPEPLQVDVEDVGAAQQHRAALGLHGAREQRGQRRLAGAGAPDQGAGVPGGTRRSTCSEREPALLVGEVQVAEVHVERAVGQLVAADGLALGAEHAAQPEHGTEARLQVGQVPRQLVDLADEHRGDEEERHQGGGVEAVVDDQRDPHQRGGGEHGVEQRAGAAPDPALEAENDREPGVDGGGERRAAPHHVALPEAGAQVVAPRHALLHGRRVVGPGRLLLDLAGRDLGEQGAHGGERGHAGQREQHDRRPPRDGGDHPERPGGEQGADRLPRALPEQDADLVRVVVDAVEHLAHGLLRERRERLVQRGVEQVRAQPALGPVDDPGPDRAGHGVEQGRPDRRRRPAARPAWSSRARRAGRRRSEPSELPTAATAQHSSAQAASGLRSRRQSTVRSGSDGGGGVRASRAESTWVRVIGHDATTRHRRSSCGFPARAPQARGRPPAPP